MQNKTLSPHTVVVILESKPGKEETLKAALQQAAFPSAQEGTNIDYRLHQNPDNPAQFVLYENWVSKEKHQEQFDKPYIKELGEKLDDLLAKPFQAFFVKELPLAT
jgi:quinol monooxygenase YgiN